MHRHSSLYNLALFALLARLLVLFENIYTLDQDAATCTQNTGDDRLLAFVFAGKHYYIVSFLDSHDSYTTSGAREAIV